MDRSLGTTSQPRIQDVTNQILKINEIYGSSDNTSPGFYSSNKSLNYASGASITKPEVEKVSVIPYKLDYKDTVGLFGAENHFVMIETKVPGDILFKCFEETNWECAMIIPSESEELYWIMASIDPADYPVEPGGYEQANISRNELISPNSGEAYISVELKNKGTGNQYNDVWLDTRLYTKNREEHPYNKMYVRLFDKFYIGFHARNTRRLGYDVECLIGDEYIFEKDIEDKRLIMKR